MEIKDISNNSNLRGILLGYGKSFLDSFFPISPFQGCVSFWTAYWWVDTQDGGVGSGGRMNWLVC